MSPTIEQEILEQEERLAEAKRALDLQTIDRVYADDLLMTGVLGEPLCTKSAVIDEIKRGIAERERALGSGRPIEMATENQDMTVVRHGDTAIANYRFVVTVTGQDVHVHRRYRTTNVWMKQNGRWQIVAAHMAFIVNPQQAAMLAGESARA